MMQRVSVIVPVYNIEELYLNKCIESILGQDYQEIELLLINDGSENNAGEVCQRWAEADSRVVYISQNNAGVSAARNAGLDRASGDFLMFVDADDYLSPGVVGHLIGEMGSRDLLFFGYCTNYTNREITRVMQRVPEGLFESGRLQLAILKGDKELGVIEIGAPWGKFIRRSVVEENKLRYIPGLKKGQDTVFTLYLLEHCRNIGYSPFAGYHYRMLSASISHRYNSQIVSIMERTLKAYGDFLDKNNKPDAFRRALYTKYYRVMTGEYLELYFLHRDNKESREKLKGEYISLINSEPYATALKLLDDSDFLGAEKRCLRAVRKGKITGLWLEKGFLMWLKSLVVRNF